MKVLGIETSCDETAVAIVDDAHRIHANLVLSQISEHSVFGGVVPEIAARAHMDHLDKLIRGALDDAGMACADLDGIAATCGPGLIGGVMVGMMAGKALALAHGKPFIAVNHLEAHALTPRLTDRIDFPYLLLLVSGGHTQILMVHDVGRYELWGSTMDDALGECFDKSAKLMGLPFPGGPHLEQAARLCSDPDAAIQRFPLPAPLKGRPGCDFSFSGLKTAIRAHVDKLPPGPLHMEDVSMLACAFEQTICTVVTDRCRHALEKFTEKSDRGITPKLVVSGGVAANLFLRAALKDLTKACNADFIAPPVALCADNGAMIAWTGIERLRRQMTDNLNIAARPRWPLDPEAGQGFKSA